MEDLGSGCLIDFSKYGLTGEPTVQDSVATGADIVTFSGDKLLGGPQCGIIVGKEPLISAIKANQLNRALRVDKLTLLALQETLSLYRNEERAIKQIPTLSMLCQSHRSLRKKAERLVGLIGKIATGNFALDLVDGVSRVGGGAMPVEELPSRLLCIAPRKLSAQDLATLLRSGIPPIIARLEKDHLLLDVRTIQDKELKIVAGAIRKLSTQKS
jgi:L-seryl-tRNA(Ser) seleniumtransferase